MSISTTEFLPTTTYGTAAGNYNGVDPAFIGNAVPAASYYGGQGSVQTATVTTTGFVGRITIQATLATVEQQAAWTDLVTIGNGTTPLTTTTAPTFVGNFVWLRAVVTEFSAGVINSARVVY